MSYSNQAANHVFDYIVGKIRANEWTPGTKIETEAQLGENLDVSRIAVRQAIEKLAALSVLNKVQGSGTYVNTFEESSLMGLVYYPPTLQTMLTVLEFRRMFDPYNTELFIDKCSPQDVASLEENYRNMIQFSNDIIRFRFFDNEFHHIIAQGTHNVVIAQISALLTELLTEHQTALYQNTGPEHAIKYHGLILDCIKESNAELANIYARIHIENSMKNLIQKAKYEQEEGVQDINDLQ